MHTEHLEKFRNQKDTLPQKQLELDEAKKQLEKLEGDKKRKKKSYSVKEIKKRAQLKEDINRLEHEINRLGNNFTEMEYYSKVYDIVFDYYDATEGRYYNTENAAPDSEDDDNGTSGSDTPASEDELLDSDDKLVRLNEMSRKNRKVKKTVRRRGNMDTPNKSQSILSLLSGGNTVDEGESEAIGVEKIVSNKASLKDEYLTMINPEYVCNKMKSNPIKTCSNCNIEKTLIQGEGICVCQNCGESEHVIIESEVPSHKDAINEKPKYPYKKINHLIEKLNQFQSKETNNIPDVVFDIIEDEIKKKNLDKDDVDIRFVKNVLKKYRFNKYYENQQYIFSKVTGTPPPILSREQEEEVKRRFKMIDAPFKRHKPSDRSNFLNYAFVLNKIFLLMGLPNHAKYFPPLKSKEKRKLQDQIWKLICEDLGWPFHSSTKSSCRVKRFTFAGLHID
jgi:hypothetical protein